MSREGLVELAKDETPGIAAAAEEALRCVDDAGADPRLLLLVIEAALEGAFEVSPGRRRDLLA